jgi:hypothetical protein
VTPIGSVLRGWLMVALRRNGRFLKNDKSLTYKPLKEQERYQFIKKFSGPMRPYKNLRTTKTPYWNFWKVVLAGWIIRYPRPFFVALGFCMVVIYNVVTK